MSLTVRALAVLLFLLAGCGEGGDPGAAASPCVTPPPAGNAANAPKDLPFEEWGTVTYIKNTKRYVAVRLVSETTVVELHPEIARGLVESGYKIVGADNEGFESEIFVDPRGSRTGYLQLREGPCRGLVTTNLLIGEAP